MKKLFCPTDFSDSATNAIAFAGKLTKKLGATLTLFNVQSLGDLTPEEALFGDPENVRATEAKLEALRDEVKKVFKISCNVEVVPSAISVNKLISSHAAGYDLIVMGSNGPDELTQFFLGSNTYQVIKKSSTPVIMIPEGCGYSDIKTIVYAFDYWRNDRLPLTQLIRLAKSLKSDLRVLQVMEESYSRKAEEEVLGMQEIFLDLYKDEIPISFDTIYASDLTDSLHNYMLRNKMDMLALCTENHGFLQKLAHKSVVKAMSGKATYPLFVFHA